MKLSLIIAGVLSTLTIFLASPEVVDYGVIKILHASEFPLYSDQLFYLFFSSRVGEFPIFSVLIFIIRDGVKVLEKGYFYPGFFYELESPFMGEFLKLIVATVHTNNSISVRVQFNETANWRQLEVRYGEFMSRDKMNYAKENFWLYTSVMYSRTIQLMIRMKLTLNTLTPDGRMDGVVIQEPAYLVCRGSHGYPRQRVQLIPGYRHKVLQEEYQEVINEHKILASFDLRDHGSTYECAAADTRSTAYVSVFHHPTRLHLEPYYYSTMPNGSSVKCVADDGFPGPKMLWYFLQGPANPDLYFNVLQDQLSLLPNAPIGSEWTFKCVGENVIPNSGANSTSLLFKFTVIHSFYRNIIIMGSSAVVVVAIVVIVTVLVIIFSPRKTAQRRPVPKIDPPYQKELAFDPDTAGSLKLSQSTECVHDGVPRYEDISNGDIDTSVPMGGHGASEPLNNLNRKYSPKEATNNTCYV